MKKLAIAMALMFALGAVPSFAVNPAERQALIDNGDSDDINLLDLMM
ncbi:MAG: hypothetical protein Nk1A_7310 [Endomicrobiia bacterium]|nr:MAG: hypothetical protein Nk1A_7310 [Endomicrobiia bacterium]